MAARQLERVVQTLRSTTRAPDDVTLTDGQLLERYVRSREEAAFADLVQRHGPMVWGVCRRVLGRHHDIEDAFQAAFLVLVRKAASIVPRDLVGNWLYGVAHQTALKARATIVRRQTREKQVMAMPEPAVVPPELGDDVQALLDEELSRLPGKYRALIVLCDLEGKTHKEAARHFHLPQGTVASRLATARTMLARRLARRGVALPGAALAALLAPGSVSPSVAAATVQAAGLFAAGGGAVSVKAVALAEGVLRGMLLTRLEITTAVLVVFALFGAGAAALTRPGVADRPAVTPQRLREQPVKDKGETTMVVSGILKAVRPAQNTVTVAHSRGRDTFTLAKGARIVLDGKPGTLAGLPLGSVVSLKLLADGKRVRGLHAERPEVVGVVKAVDGRKNTLTVDDRGAEKTFTLTRFARVEIDGKPGKLLDVPPGARVRLDRVDVETADRLRADGPPLHGLVKGLEVRKRTLTVADRIQPSQPERTFLVPGDAPIEIDGERGTLARLPVGAIVNLALSADQKTVRSIRADGPGWRHIIVKAIDAGKRTITFGDHKAPVELTGGTFPLAGKTFPVRVGADVTIDGRPGKLGAIPPGALVAPNLTADQKSVRSLQAYGPGGRAWLAAVDAAKCTLTFDDRAPAGYSVHETRALADLAGKTLAVAGDADITLDGKPGPLSRLPAGTRIAFGLSVDRRRVLVIGANGPGWGRVEVKALDPRNGTLTFDDKAPPELAYKTFPLAPDAEILIDGKPGRLAALPVGVGVALSLSVDQKTVRNIRADGRGWAAVVVKAVDARKCTLTFDDDKAPPELAGKTFPLAGDAAVTIDDRPGKLADLPPGTSIDVGLSADQKTVRAFQATGPAYTGVVKAVDPDKGTLTFDAEQAPAEVAGKTFRVASDAAIAIDGKAGKVAGIARGAVVTLTLGVDRKTVRKIQAKRP